MKWYSIGTREKGLDCVNCNSHLVAVDGTDHHPGICSKCGKVSFFFDFANEQQQVIQVMPELAPSPVRCFIEWAQESLDELEFIELVANLEEMLRELK